MGKKPLRDRRCAAGRTGPQRAILCLEGWKREGSQSRMFDSGVSLGECRCAHRCSAQTTMCLWTDSVAEGGGVDDAARNVPIFHLHHVYTARTRLDKS